MPKIEKKNGSGRSDKSVRGGKKSGGGSSNSSKLQSPNTGTAEEEPKPDLKPAPLAPLGSRKGTANNDLDPVAEAAKEE